MTHQQFKTEGMRQRFDKKFISEDNTGKNCWSVIGMRTELVLDFIQQELTKKDQEHREVLEKIKGEILEQLEPSHKHGVDCESFLEGRISEAEAKEETKRATRAYARRQETWFSRDARIKWLKGGTKERLDSILSSTISR